MNRTRKTLAATLAAGMSFALAACGSGSSHSASASGSGGSGKSNTVTVNSLPILSLAPMMVAQAKGFFTKQGVNVKMSSSDIYAQLAVQSQGNLDVDIPGVGGAFFNAVNQGLKVVAVADRQQYKCASDNMLLVGTKAWNNGVHSVKDLKGKKVAILAKGSTTEYWLSLALQKVGLKESDLGGIVTLGYPDTVNALQTGAVDAGFLVEPLADKLLQSGGAKRLLAMHEVAPNEEQGLITMSKTFISQRPDVAAHFLAGWLQAVRYYEDPANKADVVKILADGTKVPASVIGALYGTDQWPYINPNGEVDTDTATTHDGKWLVDNKVIEHLPPVTTWYDSSVVQSALKIVGRVDAKRDCSSITPLGG